MILHNLQTHRARHHRGTHSSVSQVETCNINIILTKDFPHFVVNAAFNKFVDMDIKPTTI